MRTSATVDDAMMWAEYKFKDFSDGPRNNSLRHVLNNYT